jgi:hypothetical protein
MERKTAGKVQAQLSIKFTSFSSLIIFQLQLIDTKSVFIVCNHRVSFHLPHPVQQAVLFHLLDVELYCAKEQKVFLKPSDRCVT